jgi:photosystem II stability/assembly factor-like uncharacterized protein
VSDRVGVLFQRNHWAYPFASGIVLRTGDGGRTWTRMSFPGTPTAVGFLDEETGVAALSGTTCASEVWRTGDGGGTWKLLPGLCTTFVHALDAVDPTTL